MAQRQVYRNDTGVRRTVITEDSANDGSFLIETKQRVGDVIAEVARLREANHVIGHRKSRTHRHVAEIPLVIWEQAMKEGWANDPKKIRQWINDPANRPFRVSDGRF